MTARAIRGPFDMTATTLRDLPSYATAAFIAINDVHESSHKAKLAQEVAPCLVLYSLRAAAADAHGVTPPFCWLDATARVGSADLDGWNSHQLAAPSSCEQVAGG